MKPPRYCFDESAPLTYDNRDLHAQVESQHDEITALRNAVRELKRENKELKRQLQAQRDKEWARQVHNSP